MDAFARAKAWQILPNLRTKERVSWRVAAGPVGRWPALDEAEHSLLQLRIYFVCDSDHVQQHRAEVHFAQIVL
jgi:hypothetical protein